MTPDIFRVEGTFIGCLLKSPDTFWRVQDGIRPDMFSTPHYAAIYTAIRDLSEAGRKVSVPTLSTLLPEEYEGFGPTEGILASLRATAEEAGSAEEYAEPISAHAGGKQLSAIAKWIEKELKSGQKQPDELAAELSLRAQSIMAQASPIKPVKLYEATKRVVAYSTTARDRDVLPGFTTGLRGLDEMTGLLMGGDFIGILGALGEGKSALLTQIGKHIGWSVPVLACHNEMSEDQNATRAVSSESGLSVREVREGAYDFAQADDVKAAQERIEKSQVYLYTDPKMTVRAIKARALQLKRTVGLGAITIDGLKRLKTEGKHRDRWDRLEEVTGSIKELAIELNVPILLAVQRTRTARRRDDPTPHLDDADAPSLELDCDMVLAVWREESWLQMNKPPAKAGGEALDEWEGKIRRAKGIAKVIALKVRSGEPFVQREFKWLGRITTYEDL